MLERQTAIDMLISKYRGIRLDKTHAIIFTFPNGKQVAAENTQAKSQRTTFSIVVNALPPEKIFKRHRSDPEHYPRGGKRHNHNITKRDAPTLYWRDYDTWRIYPDSALELEAFLNWYIFGEDEDKPNGSNSVAASDSEDLTPRTPTEREAVVKVRYGQGRFRDKLIKENGRGPICWMSGIEGRYLLIASHIKPWSHCENDHKSKEDVHNGLLLSALWDAAFDAGLITFDDDWKVIASVELSQSARDALNITKYSVLPEDFHTTKRRAYLAYHRAEVFENWKKDC